MEKDFEKAKQLLRKNNQEHIIQYLEKSKNPEKLVEQILNMDFEQLSNLYESTKRPIEIEESEIQPIKFVDKNKLPKEEVTELEETGKKIIRENHYAVVTMAGGQGTRLGHKGPKGTFLVPVEPEPKYIFQILTESLIRENQKYGVVIPWYIMTSEENNEETIAFFEEHGYFGYPKEKITFFKQGKLPIMNTEGKLLMDKNGLIREASDGNGSIYASLAKSGALEKMKQEKIQWIFIGAVDNILLNMVDPSLIGLCIKDHNQIASRTVTKISPKERVGVFGKKKGHPAVIEYSEIPEEMAEEVDEDGELLYGEANIVSMLYSMEALEKASKIQLNYHKAVKKMGYLDENGQWIEPKEPNAFKFESFMFDVFESFDDISILRSKREENFAPIKNAEGADSPETARKLYNQFHQN